MTMAKTLGPRAAHLLAALHDRSRLVFRLKDVEGVLGLSPPSARSFTRKLVDRGVATRLRPGLFTLVPFELGSATEYLCDPLLLPHAFVRGEAYYLSYATAMDIHDMLTQPQLVVWVSTPRRRRAVTTLGLEYRFVVSPRKTFFGLTRHWVTKQASVPVSDLERTIVDGLRRPGFCGGITEVAKGLWIRREDMDVLKLVRYSERLKIGAVYRRLGFLLELYELGSEREHRRLRKHLTNAYATLDPLLPSEGKYLRRWRLRLNVGPEELRAVRRT